MTNTTPELSAIDVRLEADLDAAIVQEIEENLLGSLQAAAAANAYRDLAIVARDQHGKRVGGLIGSTSYGWLLVKMLWVAQTVRGQGLGTKLMRMAEQEARSRGCHAAWLDTSSARARAFYDKLGYQEFGLLENQPGEAPEGHRRSFMCKRLEAQS